MKKREAKRVKPSINVDIEAEMTKTLEEQERIKEEKLIDLIVSIIVESTLKQYYDNKKSQ